MEGVGLGEGGMGLPLSVTIQYNLELVVSPLWISVFSSVK